MVSAHSSASGGQENYPHNQARLTCLLYMSAFVSETLFLYVSELRSYMCDHLRLSVKGKKYTV